MSLIIPADKAPPPAPLSPSTYFHSIKTLQCFSTYFYGNTVPIEIESFTGLSYCYPLPFPLAGNVVLRSISCLEAFREKAYWKIAFDIVSLASLYWIGPSAAFGIDCASETANLLFNVKDNIVLNRKFQEITIKLEGLLAEKDELDCTIQTNALMVLGLTETEANDNIVLKQRYEMLRKCWKDRIKGAAVSPLLVKKFTQLLRRVEIAYQTIRRQ